MFIGHTPRQVQQKAERLSTLEHFGHLPAGDGVSLLACRRGGKGIAFGR